MPGCAETAPSTSFSELEAVTSSVDGWRNGRRAAAAVEFGRPCWSMLCLTCTGELCGEGKCVCMALGESCWLASLLLRLSEAKEKGEDTPETCLDCPGD